MTASAAFLKIAGPGEELSVLSSRTSPGSTRSSEIFSDSDAAMAAALQRRFDAAFEQTRCDRELAEAIGNSGADNLDELCRQFGRDLTELWAERDSDSIDDVPQELASGSDEGDSQVASQVDQQESEVERPGSRGSTSEPVHDIEGELITLLDTWLHQDQMDKLQPVQSANSPVREPDATAFCSSGLASEPAGVIENELVARLKAQLQLDEEDGTDSALDANTTSSSTGLIGAESVTAASGPEISLTAPVLPSLENAEEPSDPNINGDITGLDSDANPGGTSAQPAELARDPIIPPTARIEPDRSGIRRSRTGIPKISASQIESSTSLGAAESLLEGVARSWQHTLAQAGFSLQPKEAASFSATSSDLNIFASSAPSNFATGRRSSRSSFAKGRQRPPRMMLINCAMPCCTDSPKIEAVQSEPAPVAPEATVAQTQDDASSWSHRLAQAGFGFCHTESGGIFASSAPASFVTDRSHHRRTTKSSFIKGRAGRAKMVPIFGSQPSSPHVQSANTESDAGASAGPVLPFQAEQVAPPSSADPGTRVAAASATSSSTAFARPGSDKIKGRRKVMLKQSRCDSCFQARRAASVYPLGCEHRFCRECLKELFVKACGDRSLLPVKCCRQVISMDLAKAMLSSAEFQLLAERTEEQTANNKMYCPSKTCGKFINLDKDLLGVRYAGVPLPCPHCKQVNLCVSCKSVWHPSMTCAQYQRAAEAGTEELARVAQENGWKLCPQCRTFVELRQGCNHITCVCKAEFCYRCGAAWRTCSCPLFSYEEEELELGRRVRAQQLLGHRVNDVQRQQMRAQMQRQECDQHRTRRVQGNCGDCRNCGFYMNCYGYVCEDCNNAFCYMCIFHRM